MIKNLLLVIFVSLLLGCTDSGTVNNWPNLGIVVNNNEIKKEMVAKCCFRGNVRTIQVGDFLADEKLEVAILGQTGILFLNAKTLEVLEKVKYKTSSGQTIWFGLSPSLISNNSTQFSIMQGGSGFGDIGLLDSKGKRIWRFKISDTNPDRMVSTISSKDSTPIFYVSDKSDIYQLDISGSIIWKLPKKATDLTVYKSKENNKHGLAALDKNGRYIYLVEDDSSIYKAIKLNNKATHFDSVHIDGETLFVTRPTSSSLEIINLQGTVLFEHVFNNIPVRHGPISKSVNLKINEKPHIAVLMQSRSSIGKSLLSIFTLSGDLMYQEVLDGGTGIEAVGEKLLVGDGTKHVWAYH